MRIDKLLFVGIICFSCKSHHVKTTSEIQNNQTFKSTMVGADKPIRNACNDSCVISYNAFTIVTKPHKEAVGEDIFVILKKNGKREKIDVKDDAQYFYGAYKNKIIVDVGTGSIRRNFIYDVSKHILTDSIDMILDDSKIVNGKINYLAMMNKERVDSLHLPVCEDTGMETNGYYEEFNYDIATGMKVSTGKYKCMK